MTGVMCVCVREPRTMSLSISKRDNLPNKKNEVEERAPVLIK